MSEQGISYPIAIVFFFGTDVLSSACICAVLFVVYVQNNGLEQLHATVYVYNNDLEQPPTSRTNTLNSSPPMKFFRTRSKMPA